jgi:Bifunctional DNA primase/polymerase, N-terminal
MPYEQFAELYWKNGFNPIPGMAREERGGKVGKVPLVKWRRFQRRRMTESELRTLMANHSDAPLTMLVTGEVSNLTVVDVDGDGQDAPWALETFGEPATMGRTWRGGPHLWASYSGEVNAVRLDGRHVDVRGEGGIVVAPGSVIRGSLYQFERGGFERGGVLPPRHPISAAGAALLRGAGRQEALSAAGPAIPVGERNSKLFSYALDYADGLDLSPETWREEGPEKLERELMGYNISRNKPPLTQTEVRQVAASVYGYAVEGRLMRKGQDYLVMRRSPEIDRLIDEDPVAYALLARLRRDYGYRNEFKFPLLTKSEEMGWSKERLIRALNVLQERGFLVLMHKGGRWSPAFAQGAGLPRGDASVYCLPEVPQPRAIHLAGAMGPQRLQAAPQSAAQ